jgi:hypothetical protein
MKCKICTGNAEPAFKHLVLNKYDVQYYRCPNCYFIQTEEPYWLDEAYNNPLNLSDTGILKRNAYFLKKTAVLDYFLFGTDKKHLDYAGGYGVFTRMMRDVGFDYYWTDKYADNLLARGFEAKEDERFATVSAFEFFEHVVNPVSETKNLCKYADTIIFSTVLHGQTTPNLNWWYYAFNHGQHVAFHSLESLQVLAKSVNMNLYSNGTNFHVFSARKLSPLIMKFFFRFSPYGIISIVKAGMKSRTDADSAMLEGR